MSFVDDIAYYRRRESQERMASEDAVGDAARKALPSTAVAGDSGRHVTPGSYGPDEETR